MPKYDHRCLSCGEVREFVLPVVARRHPQACECGGLTELVPPMSATYLPFTAYHDEGLGIDVHGRRERKEILKARGLEEAGDRVHGARNVELSPHANRIVPQAPKGIRLSDIQREEERNRKAADDFVVNGVRTADLPSPTTKPKKDVTQIVKQAMDGLK